MDLNPQPLHRFVNFVLVREYSSVKLFVLCTDIHNHSCIFPARIDIKFQSRHYHLYDRLEIGIYSTYDVRILRVSNISINPRKLGVNIKPGGAARPVKFLLMRKLRCFVHKLGAGYSDKCGL